MLSDGEEKVWNVLLDSEAAYFSELQKATRLNPKTLTKALDSLMRMDQRGTTPVVKEVVKVVLKGGLGKALAGAKSSAYGGLKENIDPELWEEAEAKALADKLEMATAGRPLYMMNGLMSEVWVSGELESEIAQGWVSKAGDTYDLTAAGRKHFGL